MNTLHANQKTAVLVDSQNLYHTAKHKYGKNIDYRKLLNEAVSDRKLLRALAYVVEGNTPNEEDFFDALVEIGYELRRKEVKEFTDGTKKADWDVGITIDAISLAEKSDTIVLCTGDGDFSRLCDYLRHEGVKVEIRAFKSSMSNELIEAADEFYNIGGGNNYLM